jgi:hypothetical protein
MALGDNTGADRQDPQVIFERMARFLAGTRQFQVTLTMGYEVVQTTGQKLEFSERRQITVARPDRFRVDIQKSNGEAGQVFYDGQRLTVYSETHRVYAQTEKPGRVDDALVYLLRNLDMRMPLALMFHSRFPEEMQTRIETLSFVELSAVTDTPCAHLAGRTGEVDFQIWIPSTGEPLPRRVVITYRQEAGQPSFWADFSDWRLATSLSAADFAFSPPDGAERIPFLAEMRRATEVDPEKGRH